MDRRIGKYIVRDGENDYKRTSFYCIYSQWHILLNINVKGMGSSIVKRQMRNGKETYDKLQTDFKTIECSQGGA